VIEARFRALRRIHAPMPLDVLMAVAWFRLCIA
jgi:hypothetical protein